MNLSDPVTSIPKVGPSVAKKLEHLGIITLHDLIYHFPFRYEDSSSALKISDLVNHVNEIVTVRAKIMAITPFRTKYGKVMIQAKLYDETGTVDAVWFNQIYVTTYLKKETEAIFYGKLGAKGKKLSLASPKYEVIQENAEGRFLGKIVGIYPETRGLTSRFLLDKIKSILDQLNYDSKENGILIKDQLSKKILEKYELVDIISALRKIHTPENEDDIKIAKDRLAFDEILEIQKTVLAAKKSRTALKAVNIKQNDELLREFVEKSAFKPTNAQLRSVREIISDMTQSTPMNRLLEGDVGSGKTWVAAAAALQSLKAGSNVAFLAPTSVLANQHSQNLVKMIEPYGINVSLVTSATRKQRNEEEISIKPTLYIGTHALLHDPEITKNLALVIVDEQHRFGVKQREYLLELESEQVKTGERTTPHFLSMTATPIPRSMALTVFGDLDLSLLDELPPGRVKIDTYLVNDGKRKSCYDWAKKELSPMQEFGRNEVENQMFVICPLIEESENMQAKSAVSEFENIKKEFSDFKVELLHGRMPEKEKTDILARYAAKEFHILVATPVIEVGIDIKDATIIMIESSERFGLAQLHQLRGRVGRSNKKSYCVLYTSNEDFPDRLKFFAQTDLGIKLAEFDLASRGPGEVYGTKQSGIPKLRIANIMDVDLVKKAREALEFLES